MEGELKRPPSLYIHDPYGRGQMLRLAPADDASHAYNPAYAPQYVPTPVPQPTHYTHPSFPTISVEGAAAAEFTPIETHRPLQRRVTNSLGTLANITNMTDTPNKFRNSSPTPSGSSSGLRSPKPRKNHSAGLAGRRGEPVPVCLDYLKGVCNRKRWRCKFAHPTLSLDVPSAPISPGVSVASGSSPSRSPGTSPSVCEVWALTGFCKFGQRCRDFHPPVAEPITKVCAPATTVRMTTASREQARRLSEHSGSSGECESPVPFEGADDSIFNAHTSIVAPSPWQEARRVLMMAHWGNMDQVLGELFHLLNAAHKKLSDDQFLALLFGMAIDDANSRAAIFATICARLVPMFAEGRQHEIRLHLVRLAESVLHADTQDLESLQQRQNLAHRKRGTAKFMGELFRERLIPIVRLQSALDYCTRRASEQTEEGALHAELGNLFVEAIGNNEALDLQRTVKRLSAATSMHNARAQQQLNTTTSGVQHPPIFA